MRKNLVFLILLISFGLISYGQSGDPLATKCMTETGNNTRYLIDYRIELPKASSQANQRYMVNLSLWKETKYRFSMCTSEDSGGMLYLILKDSENKVAFSSFDKETGKTYPFIDFLCIRSGLYQLSYYFTDGQAGKGVGVVSMVK